MIDDSLIILAGGLSSRMKKQLSANVLLTDEEKQQSNKRSKSLISIGNNGRPLMDYLLYNAKKAGYLTIYIVTGKENTLFKTFYGAKNSGNNFNKLTINYVVQSIPKDRVKPFGTADAVYQAYLQYPELKNKNFTVCNSDNLYSVKTLQLLREFTSAPNALISYDRNSLQFSEERISKFALMQFDKHQYLIDIIEKPSSNKISKFADTSGILRVSMNIFKFDGSLFFEYIKNCPINLERNEKELPTALLNMVKGNLNSVIGIPIAEHVPDLTSKEDIFILKKYIKKNYKQQLEW